MYFSHQYRAPKLMHLRNNRTIPVIRATIKSWHIFARTLVSCFIQYTGGLFVNPAPDESRPIMKKNSTFLIGRRNSTESLATTTCSTFICTAAYWPRKMSFSLLMSTISRSTRSMTDFKKIVEQPQNLHESLNSFKPNNQLPLFLPCRALLSSRPVVSPATVSSFCTKSQRLSAKPANLFDIILPCVVTSSPSPYLAAWGCRSIYPSFCVNTQSFPDLRIRSLTTEKNICTGTTMNGYRKS